MKIAVINESGTVYNLATDKIKVYHQALGDTVVSSKRADAWAMECDKAYLSAIFTWDLPRLVQDAQRLKSKGIAIEIGGPAATAMSDWVKASTGIDPHKGTDERFEFVKGTFPTTFTSRGCPRSCGFCLVQYIEGHKMIEYPDFNIPVGKNPWVCDNNILSTSWEHQLMVVDRLKEVRNLDFNSGFDDRIFIKDPEKYWDLYRNLHLECWRFAYDKPDQIGPVTDCVRFLAKKGVNYRKIIVFCLVGWPDQTFKEAQEKLQYLVDIECSPYPMRYKPLNAMTKDAVAPNWTNADLNLLFSFYGVPYKWRKGNWEQYLQKFVPSDPMQGKMMI